MASKIDELIYKLGLEVPSSVNTAINIEAGKAGYEKYLADYAEETARYNELSDKKFKNWSNGKYNPNGKYEFYQLAAKRDTESVWMPTAEWTEDDRMRFGEKYARNKDEAIAYGRSVNDAIKTKAKEQKAEKIANWTEKNAFNSALASVASVPINFVGGIIDTGMNTMEYLGTGDIQTKDKLSFTDIANTMQGTVAENLNERFGTTKGDGVLGGKGLGDVYGLAMSIAQSVAAGFTGGVGMASMFSMAASNTTSDALSRGVSADKAMLLGIVSGTAEMALEKLSFEKLLKVSSAEGVSNVFKGILKQAGQEATEEGLTSIINEFADRFIAADKSNYQLMVNQLIASGMSVEDAKKEAGRQIINGIMYDTIAGAASGGISAAGGIGLNRVNNQLGITKGARTANAEALQMYAPVQNELIEKGKQHETSQKVATKMESKLAEGKELSGYDLRKLASETYNAERTADVETTRKAIVEKMKTEGLDDAKAKKLGEIALNKAIGNDVSKVQDVMLKNNEIATKVYRQISEEMMDSGVGDSQWAEETPIRRLRAEKEAVKQNEAIDVENRQQTGLEKLKADIARKYGVNTKEYKINVESLEGKFTVDESNKIRYKKTEDSKIHTDGISSSLTQEDIIELSAIEKIANELGIDIYVYETKLNKKTGQREYADKDGKRYTDSGYYDTKNNTIHIDLRAGMKGEGTMLYTASHEVVHFIKENASDHFDELENLVTKALADGGYSVEKLIDKQKDILKQNGWDGTEANFDEVAREEMVADACMKFLASKNAVAEIRALKTENKGLWTALKKFFTSLFNKINKIYKTVPPDSAEAKYIADMRKAIKPIRDAFFEGAAAASKNAAKTETKTETKTGATDKKSVRSRSRTVSKITAEMTDAERYQELKNKKITAPYYNGEVNMLIAEELDGKINNEAKKAVVKIAEKLGIPGTEINIKDIDVDIKISRSNLKESISKDATPGQIAKLLPVLVPAVEQSILVERHNNRYYYDTDTVYFDNLIGGYVNNDAFVPIRFGLKHSGSGQTILYVIVDQNRISLDKIKNSTGHQAAAPDNSGASKSSLRATYSIADIIPFVKSKDLLRYLPDQMLTDEQRKAKWEAIAETINKTNNKNDSKYAKYIAKGDERSALQMVKAAAKANGYTNVVYHGTKAFGFTEFDTEKSDDKRSLFAAGSTELAQTYSGKHGTKKLYDNKNIDGLSNEEVVKMLNAEATQSYEGAEMQTEYDIMTLKDVNNLINEVNDGIDDLQKVLEGKIKEYADKMARDFDDKDAKTHSRLIEANELLKAYEYKRLSTPLYVLLHYTDALESNPEVADLEYKIRLMNKLADVDTSNGVVVKKDLGGYGVSVLTFDKAHEELKGLISSGNYALYGKPGRQLVIDAKGQNWNNIKNWIQSAYLSTKDTYVKKDDMYYRLYDSDTNEQIFHGRIEITDKNKDMSIDSLHPIMVQKANNVLAIRSEYMHTTRDIAKFAKDQGYDSIKFENLVDNGGAGKSVESGDVYVYFNPSDLKSADAVTYDDNGKVIPLSERFNEKSKDIRHKARGVEIKNAVDNATANSVTTEKYIKRLESWDGKNEDRVSDWLKVNRLQLPLPSTKSNSVNNNISQSAENVNTSSENSSEKHEIRSKARTTDNLGNELTDAQSEYFKDSKVRDAKGNLMVLYHGTTADFNVFKKGDVGYHFGTKAAARGRVGYGKNATLKEVYLNITNPIAFDEDLGSWDADYRLTEELYNRGIITQEEAESVLLTDSKQYKRTTEQANKKLASLLLDKGYDGIEYTNTHETKKPTTSYIVFDSNQAKLTSNANPTSDRDIRHKARTTVTTESAPYVSPTASSIVMDIDSGYDYTKRDKVSTAYITSQIMFTNAQAGIEHRGKQYGVKNIESLVQAARTASNQAQEMLSGNQLRIGSDTKEYQGEGLEKIARPIFEMSDEKQRAFYDYLFHYHNADRMSLERRSIEWQKEKEAQKTEYFKKKTLLMVEKNKLESEKTTLTRKKSDAARRDQINTRLAEVKAELKTVNKSLSKIQKAIKESTVLKNKPVIGLNNEQVEAKKKDLSKQISDLRKQRAKVANRKNSTEEMLKLTEMIEELTKELSNTTAEVTEEQSRKIVEEYEANYSDFLGIAEKIWNYNKNLNQYRVDTGLIDQDTFDYLNKLYPHYVPTYRADTKTGIAAIKGKNNVAVNQSIKGAKGSTKDLLNPIVIMARQTMETVRAGRVNQIADALYEGAKGDKTYIAEVSKKRVNKAEAVDIDPMDLRPKNNQVTFFKNGERITLQVSAEIFAGFDAFTPDATPNNPLKRAAAWTMDTFKKLVTAWNPAFLVRNAVRDIQDAGINSKYGAEFAKAYKDIIAGEIRNDGEYWRLFKAMGGVRENYFDFDKGFQKQQTKRGYGAVKKDANAGKVKKAVEGAESIMQRMENLNNLIETLPRFAEFIASIKSGNTAEQAMLDAADVTTNFSRVGTVTKVANKYFIPFLNPAVQGASKAIRNITDAAKAGDGKKILVAYMKLAAKATIIGILPMLLNGLMYNDDEEYEDLRETDKENNFLIKIDGKFWKIPRGRMASVIGGLLNRAVFADEFDFKGYVANISTQMSPVESASRTIFSPFVDVKNNVTWYGSAIEGKQFENLAPAKRYDESTSSIAIAMAKALNGIGIEASPKKIHYLLDQYSGVVGDFVLPATTNKAEKDFISGNFTIDPVTSNKLSDNFYDMYYEAQYEKNDGDVTAEYQVKHLNRVKSAISELYQQKSEIYNSNLSDKEKREQAEALQILINEMYKTAIEDFDLITNAIKATSSVKDEYRYAEIIRLVYGAEKALEEYNEKVYEKSNLINKFGISYDVFYKYYFDTKDIKSDKDEKGNTIPNSKKEKVLEKINNLTISDNKKLLLTAVSGYTFDEAEDREKLLKYINSLRLSDKSKRELADLLDLEYKNGKITAKS